MKSISAIILAVMTLLAVSCAEDRIDVAVTPDALLDEGELLEVPMQLSAAGFTVTNGSRAEDTEAATAAEKRISNFWLFQYDASGNALIHPRYYTVPSDHDPDQPVEVPVLLKPTDAATTIYVVANTGSDAWANKTNRSKFSTKTALEAMDIPNNFAQEGADISLPMVGSLDLSGVSLSSTVTIPMERLFAKLKIAVDITNDSDNWEYKSINVQNIPSSCRIKTRMTEGGTAMADYGATAQWYSRSHAKQPGESGGYDYIIYVPENIQGIHAGNTKATKTANAPIHALNVYVEIKYKAGTKDNEFTVCPGGNVTDDYNIRRNHSYDVRLSIAKPERGAEDVPSANCIVIPTNSVGEFQPYCRAEIGSLGTEMDNGEDRYAFRTYLDQDVDAKRMDYVKVIWQTANVIGDNKTGDKVNLTKHEYYTKGEQLQLLSTTYRYNDDSSSAEYKSISESTSGVLTHPADKIIWTINVKTTSEGNALIGGYKKGVNGAADELLWSWHIWCTDLEPDNIGKAQIYNTYEWDETGIHNDRLIPGYAIMPCNLGATSIEPDATKDPTYPYHPTRGMLYQWGRKDPFPPANRSTYETYYFDRYEQSRIVPIYDNRSQRISKITDLDKGVDNKEGYVFYSLSATTTFSKLAGSGKALDYTIHHPTCFLCGTAKDGSGYSSDINRDVFPNGGDWNPDHDNKLWGGLEPDDNLKHLVINATTGNILYDNYGENKSIFDPCPKGWRVSPPDLWIEFTETGYNPSEDNALNYASYVPGGNYMYLEGWHTGNPSFFPVSGHRRADGRIAFQGRCGNYHNATASKNNVVNCMHMHMNALAANKIFEDTQSHYRIKSLGGSIRCVRDRK